MKCTVSIKIDWIVMFLMLVASLVELSNRKNAFVPVDYVHCSTNQRMPILVFLYTLLIRVLICNL